MRGIDEREALLVRLEDGIAVWRNLCSVETAVRLDKGSGAAFRDGEIVCTRHGATFEPRSGACTYGPCEGAVLEEVAVEVHDGGVHLVDENYEFDHLGPKGNRGLFSGGSASAGARCTAQRAFDPKPWPRLRVGEHSSDCTKYGGQNRR